MQLKKLSEQVMVITGASSGIGLSTARHAAEHGTRLVLAARSENALRELAGEISAAGGRAHPVVADVSRRDDVRRVAEEAHVAFGGFDTWVNNAGIGLYGRTEEVAVEDMRKLFETNFWGVVYGSLEAVKHLKTRSGALINVGSTVSERAAALLGAYSASKHAVKGFTDALRVELEYEGAPIAVSLVKPGAIDTPFPINAKNYLRAAPQHVPPVYAPDVVASAILHCAEHPTREVFAGFGGKQNAMMGYFTPGLADLYQEKLMIPGTHSDQPPRPLQQNGLDRPTERLVERGDYSGHVSQTSAYTQASLHPMVAGAMLAGVAVTLTAIFGARGNRRG
jgi:short-subunit dehydrogenase